MTEPIRDRMQGDVRAAMKERNTVRLAALRSALAAIANAEAVAVDGPTQASGLLDDVERRSLVEDDVRAIVRRERDAWRQTAEELRRHDRIVEGDELEAQASVLDEYLADELGAATGTETP